MQIHVKPLSGGITDEQIAYLRSIAKDRTVTRSNAEAWFEPDAPEAEYAIGLLQNNLEIL